MDVVMPRDTYAQLGSLYYRIRAGCALLGVTHNTLRSYAVSAAVPVKRVSDISPGAPAARIFDPDNMFAIAQWRRNTGYIKGPNPDLPPQVLTVDVIKGGTGKTTTSVELAIHLQLLGLRCLLIDLDVQANASQMMGYEPDLTLDEAEAFDLTEKAIVTETFASVLMPYLERSKASTRIPPSENLIKKPFGPHGPHLIPSDTFMGEVEQIIANGKGHRELYIRNLLEAAFAGNVPGFDTSEYDVIIFDCPPNVSFTSTAALAAADFVVAPIRLDAFSVKGLSKLMHEIMGLNEAYGVAPELVILPTHYAPNLARIGRMQIEINQYQEMLASNVISATEEFPKSLDNYIPLTLQKPTSTAAQEYRQFAEFMHAKILKRAREQKGEPK